MTKNDRARQTVKDRLLAALAGFAGRRDWSKLTVTELIECAGVARASFYRNFKSIDEIIDYGVRQLSLRYEEEKPFLREDFRSREVMLYKFRFYQKYASLVLAFHHANVASTLLDVITDCVLGACGDMPVSSISKYELYFFSGAFYNMMLCWLEGGTRETPEAMADEFLRIVGSGGTPAFDRSPAPSSGSPAFPTSV